MYMGHIGIALAGKGVAHRVPLWAFVVAALASDLLDGLAVLVGISNSATYPITHSLPGGVGLALIAALAYAAFLSEKRDAMLIGFVTFSHILADLVTSRIPAWPGGPGIGLHIYRYDWADFAIEAAIVFFGWMLSPTLHKFSEMEVRRVVFPRAARSVANRSVASLYVRIGNASTDRRNAAIPGSVAVPARKFMQRWGYIDVPCPMTSVAPGWPGRC